MGSCDRNLEEGAPTLSGYGSPAGLRLLLLVSLWSSSTTFCGKVVVQNFVTDRLSEAGVLLHFARARCIPTSLFSYGLWGELPDWTEFLVRDSSRAEQSDSQVGRFLGCAKSAAFPYHLLTVAFLGFSSGRLAGAFRAGTIYCVP